MSRYTARGAAACVALLLAACQGAVDPLPTALPSAPLPSRVAADASPPPRDPGRPTTLSSDAVDAELAAARRAAAASHHAGLRDVSEAIRGFDLALTSRALNDLAFSTLVALREARGSDSRAQQQRLARSYTRAAEGVRPSAALGFSSGEPCVVSFDQPLLLAQFAEENDPQALFTSDPQWRQPCGTGQLHVDPLVYGHLHLVWEDPTIDCIDTDNGLFGRGGDANCVALDAPFDEPRYAGVHTAKEVLRLQRRSGNVALPFTVHSFVVVGDQPIRFRWRTGNGPWQQWNGLAGNAAYDVSAYVVGATEVQITHAGTAFDCPTEFKTTKPGTCPVGGPWFSIDDIAITP